MFSRPARQFAAVPAREDRRDEDPIADRSPRHPGPEFLDGPGDLVPEHDGRRLRRRYTVIEVVEVGVAEATGRDA